MYILRLLKTSVDAAQRSGVRRSTMPPFPAQLPQSGRTHSTGYGAEMDDGNHDGEVHVRVADTADVSSLTEMDKHLSGTDIARAVMDKRVLIAHVNDAPIGFLRWGLLWDEVPFMNLLWLNPEWRARRVGTAVVRTWESLHREAGQRFVLTSTSAAEQAQHLYRRLGYTDNGAVLLPNEPAELLFIKMLD